MPQPPRIDLDGLTPELRDSVRFALSMPAVKHAGTTSTPDAEQAPFDKFWLRPRAERRESLQHTRTTIVARIPRATQHVLALKAATLAGALRPRAPTCEENTHQEVPKDLA